MPLPNTNHPKQPSRTSGTALDKQGSFREETPVLLVEGFATYAERIWFVDFYPESAREVVRDARADPASIHEKGLRRVRQLVDEHGPEILLEIPVWWMIF